MNGSAVREDGERWERTGGSLQVLAPLLLLLASSALAGNNCVALGSERPLRADSIGLQWDPGLGVAVVQGAVARWTECPNYGSDFPHFKVGEDGVQSVMVRYVSGNSHDERCAVFVGRTITLYSQATTKSGRVVSCGSLKGNLAHEMGHVLGLEDVPEGAGCSSWIMASLNRTNTHLRWVHAAECRAVGRKWLTPAERGERADRVAGPEDLRRSLAP
jgi:hypothetical protein